MKKKSVGRFITLEGTEGAGKSTLIVGLKQTLQSYGVKCIVTREPGGTPLAECIRSVILENEMNSLTETLLYQAARASHFDQKIKPALEQGVWVLCDRFTDSTLAYQGSARGLNWKLLERLNLIATQGVKPDLTLWLKIPPEKGLKRAKDPNRFEREGLLFQEKVARGFKKISTLDPKRFIAIDADREPKEVLEQAIKMIIKKKWIAR